MLIEEYLQMRIQLAESILAGEKLAGNVPKAMAERAAIAELRGVEAFLNDASKSSNVTNDSAPDNTPNIKLCDHLTGECDYRYHIASPECKWPKKCRLR